MPQDLPFKVLLWVHLAASNNSMNHLKFFMYIPEADGFICFCANTIFSPAYEYALWRVRLQLAWTMTYSVEENLCDKKKSRAQT